MDMFVAETTEPFLRCLATVKLLIGSLDVFISWKFIDSFRKRTYAQSPLHVGASLCLRMVLETRTSKRKYSLFVFLGGRVAEIFSFRFINGLITRISNRSAPIASLLRLTINVVARNYYQYCNAGLDDLVPEELRKRIVNKARYGKEKLEAKEAIERYCTESLRKLAKGNLNAARMILDRAHALCFDVSTEEAFIWQHRNQEVGVQLFEIIATAMVDTCRLWLKRNDVQNFIPLLEKFSSSTASDGPVLFVYWLLSL